MRTEGWKLDLSEGLQNTGYSIRHLYYILCIIPQGLKFECVYVICRKVGMPREGS